MMFSVVIPTWNRVDKIQIAIESVQKQTIKNLEILICDDGSTDSTKNIIKNISLYDNRVRWIEGERVGRPAIPRNRGIKQARGDWIAFLDSDDEWLPDKLEKQIEAAIKHDMKAICTNAFRRIPGKSQSSNLVDLNKSIITFQDLLVTNNVICSSVLVHRTIFQEGLIFPEGIEFKAIEDYSLWIKIATLTNIVFLEQNLVIYNDDIEKSIRSEDSKNREEQRKIVFDDFLLWAEKNAHLPKMKKCILRIKKQIKIDNGKRIIKKTQRNPIGLRISTNKK